MIVMTKHDFDLDLTRCKNVLILARRSLKSEVTHTSSVKRTLMTVLMLLMMMTMYEKCRRVI